MEIVQREKLLKRMWEWVGAAQLVEPVDEGPPKCVVSVDRNPCIPLEMQRKLTRMQVEAPGCWPLMVIIKT